jgi:class 3 adenylate cyclase/tetratricopeptide (TPR) repeat protein
VPICAQCGEDAGPRARFCPACGATLPEPAPQRETRKVVTVLFSDVTGSTSLGERLDPESMRRVMTRYFDEMRAALEAHGGTVEKFIGDAVMAVFGVPVVHEDDAHRALRAAAEMRDRLARLNAELERDFGVRLENRTGVNTGEVVVGDGNALATGDAVNVAARLEQAAASGQILVGAATRALVRDQAQLEQVEPLEVKGKAEPVAAFLLHAVAGQAEPSARRLDVPIVGRERELRLLLEAFERSAGERSCHLFTILGPAGVGKSRLVSELLDRVGERTLALRGRCLPYGDGITYWPLADAVRQAAAITDELSLDEARGSIAQLVSGDGDAALVAERVGAAIGLGGSPGVAEEVFWAARKLMEGLASERPLVLVFDDIHWAEATFLDLIEHLAEWSRDAPILLVAMARPDLLDARPGWGGGKLNATSILLESLNDEESERLIDELLGPPRLAPDFRRRIVETAGGNPLFVEEMLAMLLDLEGTASPGVPPTIQALLAARLDQLPRPERDTLERAAVVGQEFSRAALAELGGDPAQLAQLVRKELVRPIRSAFAGDDSFRFRHLLIRDAAYAALPKDARAELHERFARWLERSTGDRVQEYEEIVAYHLQQAHRYRSELGPLDEQGERLALQAADRLESAGLRAVSRGDAPAAKALLERALGLDPSRAYLAVELGCVLIDLGEFEGALGRFAEAGAGDDPAARLVAPMLAEQLRGQMEPNVEYEALGRAALDAIPELERLGNDVALARAWYCVVMSNLIACRFAAMMEASERMNEHAARSGLVRLQGEAEFWRGSADFFGPTPVGAALEYAEANPPTGKFGEASWLLKRGGLCAMRGEFEEGRELAERGRAIYLELGIVLWYHGTALAAGMIEEYAGDLEAAERIYRESCEGLEAVGETAYYSTHAGQLARVLCKLGRFEDAAFFLRQCEQTSNPADIASVRLLHCVRGLIAAHDGRLEEAETETREAVRLSEATDSTEWHANSCLDLAEVLHAAGKRAEAVKAAEDAVRLYEQKELAALAERARERLGSLVA